ncbi:hypothetical protein, partial [Leifsonia aquatica]|uniref:hypothetical protein n=1 Tax=Leifsonia aquatica TaxID=144185 RepID=UPI000468F979
MRTVAHLLSATIGLALVLPAQTAIADTPDYSEHVIHSGPLKLTSVISPTMSSLRPGEAAGWQIGVEPLQQVTGDLHAGIALVSEPARARGMTLEVLACPVRWINHACAPGSTEWMAPAHLADGLST